MSFEDKYSRSIFYPKQIVEGVYENVLIDKFDSYNWSYPFKKYKVVDGDLSRPDLISVKNYGRQNYWWIVCRLNNVHDIWNDFSVGQLLNIPDERDIQSLFVHMKK